MADRFDVSTQSIPYGSVVAAGNRGVRAELFRREQARLAEAAMARQTEQDELARRQAESRMSVEQEQATGLRDVRAAATLKAQQDAFLRGRVPSAVTPEEATEGGKLKLGHFFLTTPPIRPEADAKIGLAPGELEQKRDTPSIAGTTQFLGDEKQQKEQRELRQTRDILAGKYDAMFADNPELGRYVKGQAMLDMMGRTGQIPAAIIDPKDPTVTKGRQDIEIQKILAKPESEWTPQEKATIDARRAFNKLQGEQAKQRQEFSFTVGDARADERYKEQSRSAFVSELGRERMTIQQGYGLVNRALSALEKDTAGADAVAVPAFISAMAGGFGSGLRMSDYEIRQVVDKAQTLWNKAASEMSRLGILPGQDQFIIGSTLRAQMKELIADAKKRAENRLGSITDTSRKLKEAKTSDDVYGLRTDYWEATSEAGGESGIAAPTALPPGVTVTREP